MTMSDSTGTGGGFFTIVPTCARCVREMIPADAKGRAWRCDSCGLHRILPTVGEDAPDAF